MTEPKRPQSRDISELKARLGLKKAAPPPAAAQKNGGIVAPPGLAPPQPAAPVVPDAAQDPFGAMNAMAQMGTAQRAPEIVIIRDDGKPVESVSSSHQTTAIAKLAGIALVPLVIGVIVGQIGAKAAFFNDGITASKAILGNVGEVKKQVSKIEQLLEEANGKNGLRFSAELTKELETNTAPLDIKAELIFRAKQSNLNPEIEGQLLSFYAGIAELKSLLDAHARAAKSDDLLLTTARKAADAAKMTEDRNAFLAGRMPYRYGIVINNPSEEDRAKGGGGDYGARLVELGPPYCSDGKLSTTNTCAEGVSGFAYRNDAGSIWNKADIAQPGPGEGTPPKTIINLLANGASESFFKGTESAVAEAAYTRRLRSIAERAKKSIEEGNRLQVTLGKKANESKRFSFGM
ncbi:MAG: hypothetical protein R3B48_06735 [Kofleriaceae bacterium]